MNKLLKMMRGSFFMLMRGRMAGKLRMYLLYLPD